MFIKNPLRRKRLGGFLLFTVMFGPAAAFAGDDTINGTWAAPASSADAPSFYVTLKIENGTAGTSVITWDGGKCSGILSGGPAKSKNSYIYDVHYTEGRRTRMDQAGCVDGVVSLYLPGNGEALYSWNGLDLDGRPMSATTVLKKQ